MAVIILSKSNNGHANKIEAQLRQKSIDIIRFNTDKLLTPNLYSLTWDSLTTKNRTFSSSEVSGVFVHHPIVEKPLLQADEFDKQLWVSGWKNFIYTLEHTFSEATWINRPSKIVSSSSISFQLDLAKSLGFYTPEFILTNSFDALVDFENVHGEIIVKSGPLLGGNLPGHRLLANKISAKDLDKEVLKNSPCFFQKYIEKDFELRVNVIEETVLACQILSQKSEKAKIDWRNYDLSNVPHFPYQLDEETQSKCIQIVKILGLMYGAIDLIVSKKSQIYFLECNSQGHWLWIEQLTGQQITSEITKKL